MRQYLTRKHHLLRALAVALFYEAFGVRVSRVSVKCYKLKYLDLIFLIVAR